MAVGVFFFFKIHTQNMIQHHVASIGSLDIFTSMDITALPE